MAFEMTLTSICSQNGVKPHIFNDASPVQSVLSNSPPVGKGSRGGLLGRMYNKRKCMQKSHFMFLQVQLRKSL